MHFLVKWIKFSVKKQNIKKILEKWPKILEKSGNFVSPEKWEPCNAFMHINQLSYFMDVDVYTQHYSHISISEPKPFSTYFKDNKNIRCQTILIGFHKSHGLTVSTNNEFLPLKLFNTVEFFIQNLILPDLPALCSVFIKT